MFCLKLVEWKKLLELVKLALAEDEEHGVAVYSVRLHFYKAVVALLMKVHDLAHVVGNLAESALDLHVELSATTSPEPVGLLECPLLTHIDLCLSGKPVDVCRPYK